MSSNHTRMNSRDYLAQVHELDKLKRGDGEAIRKAEKKAREALNDISNRSDRLYERMSNERRAHVQRLHAIEQQAIDILASIDQGTEQARQRISDLRSQIRDAVHDVDRIVNDTHRAYQTAAAMYQQAKAEFALCQMDADYDKFAPDDMTTIDTQIRALAGTDMGGAATQAQVQMLMTDIYQMDIRVSAARMAYTEDHAEALKLGERLLAQATNVRQNNREDLEDGSSRLMDIDFWTDGCFALMEQEIKDLLQRIQKGRFDKDYSHRQLQRDLKRLQELEQIQNMLVSTARAKMNLSYYRKQQGDLIETILRDDHHFTLIGRGFDRGDEREAYILRMRRHTDGAQIEVIINPGEKDGEGDIYFRIDSTTYMDEVVMDSIRQSIAEELHDNGIEIRTDPHCHAEQMPQFQPGDPITVTEQARRNHAIGERKPVQMN